MKGTSHTHQALYLKYRSKTLDDVIGQSHITTILGNALKKNRVAHAYLFTGPRGVGKTSVARILAHQITGIPYDDDTVQPDIIEIDAASNRRIDDIRDLRDKVQIAPVSAPYKVYIIDEVHMLTGESFNAFLKTLEEPPAHVVFILATTDAHKLPVTITSRTQRFTFRLISTEETVRHLRYIAKNEKIAIDDEALTLIAERGEGSFRDSISLLDQLSSLAGNDTKISRDIVEGVLGLAEESQIMTLINAYVENDRKTIITTLGSLKKDGIDPSITAGQLLQRGTNLAEDQPAIIPLLSQLISVSSSPHPDVALLIALLSGLARPATSSHETQSIVRAESIVKAPVVEAKIEPPAAKKQSAAAASPRPKSAPKTTVSPESDKKSSPSSAFSWSSVLTAAKENNIGLYSVLKRCNISVQDDEKLLIYTGSAFWKNKLNNQRYQSALRALLDDAGGATLETELIPTEQPPRSTAAAAVAEIMGGGTEISLEEL